MHSFTLGRDTLYIFGSSNTIGLENNGCHQEFCRYRVLNEAKRGCTVGIMFRQIRNYIDADKQILHSKIILFIGVNGYESNDINAYQKDLLEGVREIASHGIKRRNIIVMSALPRGKDLKERNTQMQLLRRLHIKLKKGHFRHLNSYQTLPPKLREDPSYLFGFNDQRDRKFIH